MGENAQFASELPNLTHQMIIDTLLAVFDRLCLHYKQKTDSLNCPFSILNLAEDMNDQRGRISISSNPVP